METADEQKKLTETGIELMKEFEQEDPWDEDGDGDRDGDDKQEPYPTPADTAAISNAEIWRGIRSNQIPAARALIAFLEKPSQTKHITVNRHPMTNVVDQMSSCPCHLFLIQQIKHQG